MSLKPYAYLKGEIIVSPTSNPKGIYYIEKGHVKIYSIIESGEELMHIILKHDEMFPFQWAINNTPVNRYYEAIDDVKVRRLDKETFVKYLKENPEVMFELMQKITHFLDLFFFRTENLEIKNAYPRLISRLLYLTDRFGKINQDGITIETPLTHSDLSESINATRETTSKIISKLIEKRLIGITQKRITIFNLKKLENEIVEFLSNNG